MTCASYANEITLFFVEKGIVMPQGIKDHLDHIDKLETQYYKLNAVIRKIKETPTPERTIALGIYSSRTANAMKTLDREINTSKNKVDDVVKAIKRNSNP